MAVGGAAVAAGVILAIWLGAPRSPVGSGSERSLDSLGPATASALPPTSDGTPIPTPPGQAGSLLQWNRLPGPDTGCCGRLSAVDDRIYLAGGSDDGPVLWYSDDLGRTWTSGSGEVPAAWEADAAPPTIGQVAGTSDRLVAAGVRRQTRETVAAVVWTSDDQGASWSVVTDGPFPAPGASLAWTGERFVAVRDNVGSRGRWSGDDPPLEVWSSSDGTAWQPVALPGELAGRVAVARVVGFGGRAAVLVAEASVASSKSEDHDRSGEIWLLDAEGTWTRASIGADGIDAVGIGVGPYGFLAIASGDVDEATRDLLRSTDGSEWAAHRIEIEHSDPSSPHGPLVRAGWLSVVEGEGGIAITASPGDWKTWHVAHGDPTARPVTGLTADLVPANGGFVGIWECGDLALCIGPQVAVMAALPIDDVQPDSLTGRLTSCFQDEQGYTWTLDWPQGYSVEPDPPRIANLVGPDGEVVARYGDELRDILDGGDLITVRGHRAEDGDLDECVSGPTLRFVVTAIVDVVPG
jgi:hypothetical protein